MSSPDPPVPDPQPSGFRPTEAGTEEAGFPQPEGESAEPQLVEGEDGEGEEQGECGFCLFMKGGGCKETFVDWEKCVEEAERNKEDVVEKCFQVTSALKQCMEAHADYYEPILRAEKTAEADAVRELEKEAAAKDSESEGQSDEKFVVLEVPTEQQTQEGNRE